MLTGVPPTRGNEAPPAPAAIRVHLARFSTPTAIAATAAFLVVAVLMMAVPPPSLALRRPRGMTLPVHDDGIAVGAAAPPVQVWSALHAPASSCPEPSVVAQTPAPTPWPTPSPACSLPAPPSEPPAPSAPPRDVPTSAPNEATWMAAAVGRIVVGVVTAAGGTYKARVDLIRRSWGADPRLAVVFFTTTDDDRPEYGPDDDGRNDKGRAEVYVHKCIGCANDHAGLCCRNDCALRGMRARFPSADWYVRALDDTMILPDNLAWQLHRYPPSQPWLLGDMLYGFPIGGWHYAPTQDNDDRMRRFYGFGGGGIIVSRPAVDFYMGRGISVGELCRNSAAAGGDPFADDVWYSHYFGTTVMHVPSVSSAGTTQRNMIVEHVAPPVAVPGGAPVRTVRDCSPTVIAFASFNDGCLSDRSLVGGYTCRPPMYRPGSIHMGNDGGNMALIPDLYAGLAGKMHRLLLYTTSAEYPSWTACLLPEHVTAQLSMGSLLTVGSLPAVVPLPPPSMLHDAARIGSAVTGGLASMEQPFAFATAEDWAAAVARRDGSSAAADDMVCRRRRIALVISFESGVLPLQALLEETFDLVDNVMVVEGLAQPGAPGASLDIPPEHSFASMTWSPAFGRFRRKMRLAVLTHTDVASGWDIAGAPPAPGQDSPWYATYGVNTVSRWRRGMWELETWLTEMRTTRAADRTAVDDDDSFGIPLRDNADDVAAGLGGAGSGGDLEPVVLLLRATDVLNRHVIHRLRYVCDGTFASGGNRTSAAASRVALNALLVQPRSLQLPLFDVSLHRRVVATNNATTAGCGASEANAALSTVLVSRLSQVPHLLGRQQRGWGGGTSAVVANARPWPATPTDMLQAITEYQAGLALPPLADVAAAEMVDLARQPGFACPLCGGFSATNIIVGRYRRGASYNIDATLTSPAATTCHPSLIPAAPPVGTPAAETIESVHDCGDVNQCHDAGVANGRTAGIAELVEAPRHRPFAYEFLLSPQAQH